MYEFKTRVPNSGDAKLLTFPLSLARQCTAVSNSSDDSGSTIAYLPPACNGAKYGSQELTHVCWNREPPRPLLKVRER